MTEKRSIAAALMDDRVLAAPPPPLPQGLPDPPPGRPARWPASQIARIPEIRLSNGFAVPYGCAEHVAQVEWLEKREREALVAGIAAGKAEAEAIGREIQRIESLAAEAKAAAEEPSIDFETRYYRRRKWIDLEVTVGYNQRDLAVVVENLEATKAKAKSARTSTAAEVRRTRARIITSSV